MDRPLTDRRCERRHPADALGVSHATMRPGCPLQVVDLSAAGALIQTDRPLRPGMRVHVRLVAGGRTVSVGAQVLRCAVWAINLDRGVTYRGALQFEERCLPAWEHCAHAGYEVYAAPR